MNENEYSLAIVVVAYNSRMRLNRLLNSLSLAHYDNKNISLIISIDNSGQKDVEKLAEDFEWKYGTKIIRTFEERQGLRKHIISCGDYLEKYEAIIVLEDDLLVSPQFFRFARKCIEKYQYNLSIAGISLYSPQWNYDANLPFEPLKDRYDTYFIQYAQSWGQIWLRDQWKDFFLWYQKNEQYFENEKTNKLPENLFLWGKNSWLKYHIAYCAEKDKYFVYPYYSFTSCFSEEGAHISTSITRFHSRLMINSIDNYELSPFDDNAIKYDVFFESQQLERYMRENLEDTVAVDIYGRKLAGKSKGYILSSKLLEYQIIREYGLQLRPPELNVILNVVGKGLFLYDTHVKTKNVANKNQQILRVWNYFFKDRFLLMNEIVPVSTQKFKNLLKSLKYRNK